MAADTLQGSNAVYRWLVLSSLVALGACTSAPPSPGTPEVSQLAPVQLTRAAQTYAIDAAASTLHILVYRAGPMARLGHNHVISSHSMQGRIWREATPESSGFDITVPINDLIVDDSAERATEGDEFAANVSQEAKEATKVNMLRESLLDAAHFPFVRIRSVSVQGDANAPTVVAAIHIKDQTRNVTLPVTLQSIDFGIRVKGEFHIKQTDFGITPLSVALGALQVQDTIKIKFELVAKAQ